jgi:hypothetical protein
MEADFSGYATKADIKCSDGRTITPDAFKHQDTVEVPLVWQHNHDSPMNVLGHAVLEHRGPDHADGAGIYCYGYFNESEAGQTTKLLVHNKDVKALSIYANGLVEKAKTVLHGAIKEVSVVLSGANPGAFIDNIRLAHTDGEIETLAEEAIIYTGLEIEHTANDGEDVVVHAEDDASSDTDQEKETSYKEVYDNWSPLEKEVAHFMIGAALEQAETGGEGAADTGVAHSADGADDEDADKDVQHSDDGDDDKETDTDTDEGDLTHKEGDDDMSRNQFEHGNDGGAGGTMTGTDIDTSKRISHADLTKIVEAAQQPGGSFKAGVLKHAAEYGIENIELLFPDAKLIEATPQFISRRMEWVSVVINGTKHSPLAAVKTMLADITKEEARAKGYIKGNRKEEEVFSLLSRSVRPGTIYKKQKLDRDDMLDITDINVVAWLKAEMRLMIEEELARAILVGDNRPANHPDKVKDPMGAIDGVGIRSILHDDDLYAIKTELDANVDSRSAVRGIVRAMDDYRGSGGATMFLARASLTDMMLEEDRFGRPLYANRGELADKVGVSNIVTVDLFSEYTNLFAIIVSLSDYTVGSNRGGELTSFEDFDIDFNQYKYLQETRLSGGLTKPFSAIVVTRAAGTEVVGGATAPSFDGTTDTITIPADEGVVYTIDGEEQAAGPVVITEPTEVRAEGAPGYYLPTGTTRSWFYQV